MKRIMAVLFLVVFASTLVGCACGPTKVADCPEPCLERIQALENRPGPDMRGLEDAVRRAEAAARRAEAAADKAESIFMKGMKK